MPDPHKPSQPNNENSRTDFINAGGVLFLMAVLLEAVFFVYLVNNRLLVGGNDGFEYFNLRYSFLNNVVNAREVPQWMPFVTQGSVVQWWHIMQGGILQNILLLSGAVVKNINFLPLFYAGLFIDELLLLTGIWLLGRRFFASPFTVFFVSLSIMGACIWLLQPWWNFHFYYAIPLILYFLHVFLDSGKCRYYFLAGNLLFIQSVGGLPYFLPVISLVIFLYFAFYFVFNRGDGLQKIGKINFGWPFFIVSGILAILFLSLYLFMKTGTNQIVNYTLRSREGFVPLDVFLTHGGELSWRTWLEMIFGISPGLDYTLYIGISCIPFILLGLIFNTNKRNIHFALTTLVLLLFGMGTPVSMLFYYCWPKMDYFRHLALVAPVVKVFLCFLAGFGFDALFFREPRWFMPRGMKAALIIMSLLLLRYFFILWNLPESGNYAYFIQAIKAIVPDRLPDFQGLLSNEVLLAFLLKRTALFVLSASLLLGAGLLLRASVKGLFLLLVAVLVFHGADLYSYKYYETRLKTVPLDDALYQITEFHPMPYAQRRNAAWDKNNPRFNLLEKLPVKSGVLYWTIHAFLFNDELGSRFKTDYWLLPLDQYMKAYWGQPINDSSIVPLGLVYPVRLDFPLNHPGALKISGVTEDKIQFFSQADFCRSDEMIASFITEPAYNGDRLFLSAQNTNNNQNRIPAPAGANMEISADKRLYLPYQVRRFDCNNLVLTTDTKEIQSSWLLYSDVWHPFWRATVNGKETTVFKANLAYKAVKLEKGFNTVHFYYKSNFVSSMHYVFGINSLFWLLMIVVLITVLICRPSLIPDTHENQKVRLRY